MNNPHELTDEELDYISDCWDAAEGMMIDEE